MQTVFFKADFPSWREAARRALLAGEKPDQLTWQAKAEAAPYQAGLFDAMTSDAPELAARVRANPVPRAFLEKAERVAYHRHPKKWELLYRLLWRLVHENRQLLDISVDDDVREFMSMEHAVSRDAHKMKAFVRFRKVAADDGSERYVAWHEPDHPLLAYVAPFFQDRFSVLNWTILTPDASVSWDGQALSWGPGCPQNQGPQGDALEDLWKCYYASIFNPARLKTKAMRSEMPVRYWKSLPETALIGQLIDDSEARVDAMIAAAPITADSFFPEQHSLPSLAASVQTCRACSLCESATQAVAGEGPLDARMVVIGEQPGDQEDLAGRPFVGPAGQLLDRALAEAGIDRAQLYMTNAVKHFKFRPEGKRRIHEKPSAREIGACKPWLLAELRLLRPSVVVCLGLSSGLSIFGQTLRLKDVRGKILKTAVAEKTIVIAHPSHILRITDPLEQAAAYEQFVQDLKLAAAQLTPS